MVMADSFKKVWAIRAIKIIRMRVGSGAYTAAQLFWRFCQVQNMNSQARIPSKIDQKDCGKGDPRSIDSPSGT
ncbi:hypothetical protein DQK91_00065 [Oceanidesulfovibrio marinus]|uniref:Uncharacterized protein n=1 Tax=Oceanidesulfovibrio marinus TaxID=370038 RepID=A0A6P1ZP70_9BACT|nr:hypothetical protein DQK91_00065 [Oceanidesulfovibrio marinus]